MVGREKISHHSIKFWQNTEKSQPTHEFIREICEAVDISNLPFVKHGRENEGKVADTYVQKMHEEGNTGLRVAEVGLCVNPCLSHFIIIIIIVIYLPLCV